MALSKETPPTIEELQAQLAAAQEQLAKADETIAAVTEEKQALAEEKQQLAAKADELSSQADALKTQVADLQAKPGADKAQAKVCSRPPPPITATLIGLHRPLQRLLPNRLQWPYRIQPYVGRLPVPVPDDTHR